MLFFFKQNTAYEMRISDWSSDVCSTDLFNRYIQSYVNWDKVNRQQDALACGFGHGWSPPGNHAGHGLLPRPYFTGDRGRDELRLVLGRGYKFEVYVSDPTQAAHWLDVLRSEEHTSELQSLMRISYAVFCLKKTTKKHTKKTNTPHHN